MPVPAPVLEAFGASGAWVEPWGSGHIHRTFRVRSGGPPLLLQRVNTDVFPDPVLVTRVIGRVTDHLRSKALARGEPDIERRVLRLLSPRDGGVGFSFDDGTFWRAFPFLPQVETHDRIASPTMARRAAFAFGRFLEGLEDLPGGRLPNTLPHFHDLVARLDAFEAALQADRVGRASALAEEIAFVRDRRHLGPLPDGLPERVTHNDTKLNNVLFDVESEEALCVIDLDTVMPGLALHDFGDMVRTMVSPAAEDARDPASVHAEPALFRALAEGYLDATGPLLEEPEIDHLELGGRRMTFMIGLRFLTDHLDGDRYFRAHRPNHNIQRARAQFALLRSLETQEDANRRIVESAASQTR